MSAASKFKTELHQRAPTHKISRKLIPNLKISDMKSFYLSGLLLVTSSHQMLHHVTHHEPCSSRSLGLSYHPTDSGTEEVTKPRHPSPRFVTSSQQEAHAALPLCSFSQRPSQNLSRSRKTKQKRLSFLKNTADPHSSEHKRRRLFVGCFTRTWPTLTLSWNSLFPLIAACHLYFSLKATSSSCMTWEHQTKFKSKHNTHLLRVDVHYFTATVKCEV